MMSKWALMAAPVDHVETLTLNESCVYLSYMTVFYQAQLICLNYGSYSIPLKNKVVDKDGRIHN